jgi:hypothetical protein
MQDSRFPPSALGAAVTLVALAGVTLLRDAERIFPLADIAVLEIFVRDALTGKLLVGPYSRFGWHHPGPVYFYLIAPFYAAAGRHTVALAAGAAVLLIAAMALVFWAAARSCGSIVGTALLASTTVYLWRIRDLATSPWNPHVVAVPTVALLAVCASLASGDVVMLPVAVFLASFIMQTDIALVPVVAAVTLVAAVAGFSSTTARDQMGTRLKWIGVTSVVAAALWLLPVAEQVTHSPGNLTLLWRFFVGNPGLGQPFGTALAAWAVMMAAPLGPNLLLATGEPLVAPADGTLVILSLLQLLALAAIAVWAARTGHKAFGWLAALALLASLVGLWSVTRIRERIMDHEVFWLTAVGSLNLGVILGGCGLFVQQRLTSVAQTFERAAPFLQALLVAACMFVCIEQLNRARAGHLPVTHSSQVAERLGAGVRDYVNGQAVHKPLVRIGEDVWGMTAGMLLQLDKLGVPFAVEDSWLPMFPQTFAAIGDEDAEISVSGTNAHDQLANRPGNVLVTSADRVYVDAVRITPK